jgi:cysteine desulfurase
VRRYLDHNATAPLDAEVRADMIAALDVFGNPSSVHAEGRRARDLVERARREVARLVNGSESGVIFTAGGSEAIALGVVGAARAARAAGRGARVVSSPLEHPATHGALAILAKDGFEVVLAPVDARGRVDLDAVTRALAPGAALVSLMLANHELGNVTDVAQIVDAAHTAGAVVFSDVVQAAGKHPVDVSALGVDLVALSAHKLGGPKGAGALWAKPGILLEPLVPGHQERGQRGGTEAVVNLVGLGTAARRARDERLGQAKVVRALATRLETGLVGLGARIHGDLEARLGNTVSAAFPGVPGEVVVMALDLEGIAVSTGAACTSGSVEPSPVLRALGQAPGMAAEAVRFSLGPQNRDDDVDAVLAVLPGIVARARAALVDGD